MEKKPSKNRYEIECEKRVKQAGSGSPGIARGGVQINKITVGNLRR